MGMQLQQAKFPIFAVRSIRQFLWPFLFNNNHHHQYSITKPYSTSILEEFTPQFDPKVVNTHVTTTSTPPHRFAMIAPPPFTPANNVGTASFPPPHSNYIRQKCQQVKLHEFWLALPPGRRQLEMSVYAHDRKVHAFCASHLGSVLWPTSLRRHSICWVSVCVIRGDTTDGLSGKWHQFRSIL